MRRRERPALPGLSAHFVDVDPGIARSDLMLELIDADERLGGWLEYSTDLFEAATIARMAAHLQTLLEAIVANPERADLSAASAARERNASKSSLIGMTPRLAFPAPAPFSERFARQVKRTPDAVAVSAGRVQLSYRELARRSFSHRRSARREDVGPDEVVVLLADRGVDFLAAMIAVQRAGGAFLPLDPTMPAARLAQIIQHSGTRLVLAAPDCIGGA